MSRSMPSPARVLVLLTVVALIASVTPSAAALGHYVRLGSSRTELPPVPSMGVRSAVPPGAVPVAVGESIQAASDRHPPGTAFLIRSGVHRMQQVTPKEGQRFYGEPGAVLNGARHLAPESFARDGAHWYVGGQTQEGDARGVLDPGYEMNQHPEDLWVGDAWYRQVGSRDALVPGTWFFDYAADRIYLAEDPSTLPAIETSVTPFAFGGWSIGNVVIENLTVMRYATPSQFGAIGGDANNRYTVNWQVRYVTARENHAWGILMGPGMTVTNSLSERNGQGGIAGNGTHGVTGYTARARLYHSEIRNNNVLNYTWIVEGGGTKFSGMLQGMDVVNNEVHGNTGPGIWFDIENDGNVNIESNLVHHNTVMGIHYELSEHATIKWNTVHSNSTGMDFPSASAEIDVSQSSDVQVYENLVYDAKTALYVRYDHTRRTEDGDVEQVKVWGNDITITAGMAGMLVENAPQGVQDYMFNEAGNEFFSNTFRVPSADAQVFTWGRNWEWPRMTGAEWTQIHPDEVVVDPGPGVVPGVAFSPSDHGASSS